MRRVYAGSSGSPIFRVREVDPSNATNRAILMRIRRIREDNLCADNLCYLRTPNTLWKNAREETRTSRAIDRWISFRECDVISHAIVKLNLPQPRPEVRSGLFIVSTKCSCRSLVVVIYIYIFFFLSFPFFSNYHAIYLFHRPVVAKPISATRSNGRASAQRAAC